MFGIIKGDTRYEALSKMMSAKLSNELSDFLNIDGLILPFGGIDEYYNIKQSNLNLLDILRENDIKTIVVGNANKKLKDLCDLKHIHLIELFKDQEYVMANARLTAKGIISYLSAGDKCISDEKFIILGYGNIAYYLAKLLKAYQADFQIYGSNSVEEKYIQLEGYSLADWKDGNIIINTIPANLDWNYSKLVGKRIIDVASAPYGFDLHRLQKLGIRYEIVSAIPSKYASYSAAKIIKKTIEKNIII